MTYTCHAVKKEKRESESGNKCYTCIRLCDPISTWRIVSRPSLPVGSSTARESALLHGGLHTRERVGAAKERKKKGRGLHSKPVAYSPEQTRVVKSSTETSRG